MIRSITYLLVLITLPLGVVAQSETVDGLALMKVEHGARAAGFGGAYVTQNSSPDAVVYNPAAATGFDDFSATFGHTSYWENIRIESGFFATGLSENWNLHGGIRLAGVNDLEARQTATTVPDAYFDAHDISIKSGLAYQASEQLAVGIAFGWFLEKIEAWRGSAFNFDLGMQYKIDNSKEIGASITNLGSSFQLEKSGHVGSRDISLPTTYRVGGLYRFDRYETAADIVILDDDFHAHLGAEAHVHRLFDLRAGYMIGYDTKNVTAGASFLHSSVTVDYGFVPYSHNLGTSHLFSLTFRI
ncbi:MAG: PorV/PorQ family protein [bacterium]|nr:PorV/PorQ family protein [bacterium]